MTYLVTMSADAHKEIIWFDITVDEILVVYILNATNHLKKKSVFIIKEHESSFRSGVLDKPGLRKQD